MSARDTPGLHVAVAGAGVAGLTAALILARDGHRVTLVERDRLGAGGPDGDEGEGEGGGGEAPGVPGDRQGTPQARHSHAFLGRLRKLLAEELPDVLAALHAAGASDYHILDDLPDTIDDRSPRPGDEDLVLLACRRTTFERVLRRAALAEPGVHLLDGTAVDGLLVDPDPGGGPPAVTGLRLAGDGAGHVEADVVVAAGGPRAPVSTWMDGIGVNLPEIWEESGIVYLTRFYRLAGTAAAGATMNGADPGDGADGAAAGTAGGGNALGLAGADLGYIKCAVFRGDNRTFSVTLAPRSGDQELRTRLRDPERFQRAAALFSPIAPWVAPEKAEPLTGIHTMARLGNRQRRFLDAGGQPLVQGFHAVGDAHTSTNPLYGRGCTMAMVQATLLARALRDHPRDAVARSVAYEAATEEAIAPWYHISVAQDEFNRRAAEEARAAADGRGDGDATGGSGEAGGDDGADFIGKVVRDGLLPASQTDAVVARAFFRLLNALQTPESLMQDTDVLTRIMRTMAEPSRPEVATEFRVRRRDLLDALT